MGTRRFPDLDTWVKQGTSRSCASQVQRPRNNKHRIRDRLHTAPLLDTLEALYLLEMLCVVSHEKVVQTGRRTVLVTTNHESANIFSTTKDSKGSVVLGTTQCPRTSQNWTVGFASSYPKVPKGDHNRDAKVVIATCSENSKLYVLHLLHDSITGRVMEPFMPAVVASLTDSTKLRRLKFFCEA